MYLDSIITYNIYPNQPGTPFFHCSNVPYMDVSENSGTPKSSILIGFSIIFTIHFGVPQFLDTPTWSIWDGEHAIFVHLNSYCIAVTAQVTTFHLDRAEC